MTRHFGGTPTLAQQIAHHGRQAPPPEPPVGSPGAGLEHLLRGVAQGVYGKDKRVLDPDNAINIGNQILLAAPAGFGFDFQVTQTIFEARARNEASPELVTVFISPADNSLGNQGGDGEIVQPDITLFATIEWGAGGASHSVLVDCLKGAIVTVGGVFVRVSATLRVNDDGGATTFPLQGGVSLAASASYGARQSGASRSNTLTFTDFDVVTPGNSAFFEVPAFAEKVAIYITDTSSAPTSPGAGQAAFNGTDPTTSPVFMVLVSSGDVLTVPGNAAFLRVTNTFPVDDIQVQVSFQLSV